MIQFSYFRFIQAAVSPAVVVPCLLTLSDQGYGLDKGIPTLVIAAASLDDVLAISGFTVMLGVTFSKGKVHFPIFRNYYSYDARFQVLTF